MLLTYLTDLQCGHMWQKIIANKETHEDEIIHNALKIDLKGKIRDSHFIFQILSESPNVEKLQNTSANQRTNSN